MRKYFSLNFGTFSGKYQGKLREFLFHKILGTLIRIGIARLVIAGTGVDMVESSAPGRGRAKPKFVGLL